MDRKRPRLGLNRNGFSDLRFIYQRLNYLWRVFATGLCFTTFGVGGLVLTLLVLPIAHYIPGDNMQKMQRVRKIVHHTFRYFLWQMEVLGCNRIEIDGRDRLRASRGELVIANHPSLIDVVILIACIPSACCIVKQALWRNPFLGGVVRWSGYISNTDPQSLMVQCRQALDSGFSIIVFPEGTRTIDSKSLKFQRGAANIALRCNADILPVTIFPDPPTLRKGEPWYRIPPRRSVFRVSAQTPMVVNDIVSQREQISLATRELNRHLHHYYQGLMTHA